MKLTCNTSRNDLLYICMVFTSLGTIFSFRQLLQQASLFNLKFLYFFTVCLFFNLIFFILNYIIYKTLLFMFCRNIYKIINLNNWREKILPFFNLFLFVLSQGGQGHSYPAGGGDNGAGGPPPVPGKHEGPPAATWTPPVPNRMRQVDISSSLFLFPPPLTSLPLSSSPLSRLHSSSSLFL